MNSFRKIGDSIRGAILKDEYADKKSMIQGWLTKRATKSAKNWDVRYFMLHDNALVYYADADSPYPRGEMLLSEDFFVGDSLLQPHGFQVSDLNTTYYMAAETDEEKLFWMHSIARVIRNLSVNVDMPVHYVDIEKQVEEYTAHRPESARLMSTKPSFKPPPPPGPEVSFLRGEVNEAPVASSVPLPPKPKPKLPPPVLPPHDPRLEPPSVQQMSHVEPPKKPPPRVPPPQKPALPPPVAIQAPTPSQPLSSITQSQELQAVVEEEAISSVEEMSFSEVDESTPPLHQTSVSDHDNCQHQRPQQHVLPAMVSRQPRQQVLPVSGGGAGAAGGGRCVGGSSSGVVAMLIARKVW
jgi:hypothetical protein